MCLHEDQSERDVNGIIDKILSADGWDLLDRLKENPEYSSVTNLFHVVAYGHIMNPLFCPLSLQTGMQSLSDRKDSLSPQDENYLIEMELCNIALDLFNQRITAESGDLES